MTESTKNLINSVHAVVDDFITGLLFSNPNLAQIEGFNAIIQKDIAEIKSKQVTILSGGGSGHEPAHAGFVGDGMLSGAILGNIFASPSVASILAGIRVSAGFHGVLLIVKNYTGDRLNFGMAMELAKREGIKCAMVIVDDDCALAKGKGITGGRGVAGTILVHKIVGAAARKGSSLEELVVLGNQVISSLKTMGIALSTCTIPGTQPSTRLSSPRAIEVGMGIHGEPGKEKTTLPTENAAKWVANTLVSQIIESFDASVLSALKKVNVALFVNNLGAVPTIEMGIMIKEIVQSILSSEKYDFEIVRLYHGPYMTSLDMNGLSITLLLLADSEIINLLDSPTTADAWSKMNWIFENSLFQQKYRIVPYSAPSTTSDVSSVNISNVVVSKSILEVIIKVCEIIISNEETLTRFDQICGDGDAGLVLRKGAEKVKEQMSSLVSSTSESNLDGVRLLSIIADSISASMGGSSGVLLELCFRAMSNYFTEKVNFFFFLVFYSYSIIAYCSMRSLPQRRNSPNRIGLKVMKKAFTQLNFMVVLMQE
jgi:dihydroxyacetone kinase